MPLSSPSPKTNPQNKSKAPAKTTTDQKTTDQKNLKIFLPQEKEAMLSQQESPSVEVIDPSVSNDCKFGTTDTVESTNSDLNSDSDVATSNSRVNKAPKKTTKKNSSPKKRPLEEKSPEPVAAPSPTPKYEIPEREAPLLEKPPRFEQYLAQESLLECLKKSHLGLRPEPFHCQSLPHALSGGDLLILKEEDKHDFLLGALVALSRLLSEHLSRGQLTEPSTLLVFSNQERAKESYLQCKKIFDSLEISMSLLDGHTKDQEEKPVDLLFCTYHSLHESLKNEKIKIHKVALFVGHSLQSLTESSKEQLQAILDHLPEEKTQKIFLSAQNLPKIRELAFSYLEDPLSLFLLPSFVKEKHPRQFAHALPATQKFQVLLGNLKTHNPKYSIVFANSKTVAEWIAFKLYGNEIKVSLVTSRLPYKKRKQILQEFKSGDKNVLVTTDSAVHFFGLEGLNCLYHFDLPANGELFLSRMGLLEGSRHPLAISFVCEDYGYNMAAIEKTLGFPLHVVVPDKNYFQIPDASPYPLEASGKVKKIGVVYDEEAQKTVYEELVQEEKISKEISVDVKTEPTVAPPTKKSNMVSHKVHGELRDRPAFKPRFSTEGDSKSQRDTYSARPNRDSFHKEKFRNQDNDNFVRRDEKAREAVEAAKLAAAKFSTEKQRENVSEKSIPTRPNLFAVTASIFQDAVDAAYEAAKESLAQNIEQNLPKLASFLNKFTSSRKK